MKQSLIKLIIFLIPISTWADAVFIRCPSPKTITVQQIESSGFNYRTWTQNGAKIPAELFTNTVVPGARHIIKDSIGLVKIEKQANTIICHYYYMIGNPTQGEKSLQILKIGDNEIFGKDSKLAKHFHPEQCYTLNTPEFDPVADKMKKYPIGLLCVNDVQVVSGDRSNIIFSLSEYEEDYYRELLRQVNVIDLE